MSRTRALTTPILPAVVMITAILATTSANAGETQLISALTALRHHVDGSAVLNPSQIETHKLTIDDNSTIFGDSAATIQASFDLVSTYDTEVGALFSYGSPTQNGFHRPNVTNDDIHWTMFNVMQNIMDDTYTPGNIQTYGSGGLLDGYKFASADHFPGYVAPPTDPSATYTVSVDGSFPDTWGRDTMHWSDADHPARQCTGAYLAPGSIATVTVPESLVGQGYQIRVEGHSWDLSGRNPVQRLDRCSLAYDITSTDMQVASPLGGSLYIEVPFEADAGVVDVQFQNVVRTPFFSMQSFNTTTLAEWQDAERNNPGPWADFQTDKFMMNVPTDWINNLEDPVTLMQDWDKAMDTINDLMGFPRDRGKETMYPQIDVIFRASVHAPGYPSINATYDPDRDYGGLVNYHLVSGPQNAAYYEFHEQGHAYLFPKFPGETEAEVNILHVAVWNDGFGKDLDYSFAASMGMQGNPHRTLDNTAVAWMASLHFVQRAEMATAEKAYQLKGYAKFIEIARVFGWDALGDYWRSFNEDYEATGSTPSENVDELLLRMSKAVGKDITPLFHFYGVHPDNPTALQASMDAEGIGASQEMHDLLEHYKTLVPGDNEEFRQYCMDWWGKQPSLDGYWTESEHAKYWAGWTDPDNPQNVVDMYDEDIAASILEVLDDLIATYFPTPFIGFDLGDMNLDEAVDELDWQMFIAGNQADLTGLTWEEAYCLGDLDGDGDNDIFDFAMFREAYELRNPAAGAFEAMMALYVPEPASICVMLAAGLPVLLRRRGRRRKN